MAHVEPYPTRQTGPTPAQQALAAAVRAGGVSVEVQCPDCAEPLVLVNHYQACRPPVPYGDVEQWEQVQVDTDCEDGAVLECPGCWGEIATDVVVLRDRHRRCELAGRA